MTLADEIAKVVVARAVSESNTPTSLARVGFLIDDSQPANDVLIQNNTAGSTRAQNALVPTRDVHDITNPSNYRDREILVTRGDVSFFEREGILDELRFNANIRFILNYGPQIPVLPDEPSAIEDFELISSDGVQSDNEAETIQTFKRIKVRVR